MKTLGMLGGVGPQTTAETYLSVIEAVRKAGRDSYPPIVVYNLPFPFRVEREAIVEGRNAEQMIPFLTEGARVLERSGADFGILPCNTLHAYIEDVRKASSVPFLSILEETARALSAFEPKTIGFLATRSTLASGIYERALAGTGRAFVYPAEDEQMALTEMIVRLLAGSPGYEERAVVETVAESLAARGADVILLACTDIQLAARHADVPVPIVDTMEVLGNAAVRELLA
ncbi:amino acid racemase [Patescibacteria group bacterium]|nr:amino acid racemase [Patescibacteria group bacterium]